MVRQRRLPAARNSGVHGAKAGLHLERLWAHNVMIATRLASIVTAPMLLKTVQSKTLDPNRRITCRVALSEIMEDYNVFGRAADDKALKVPIEARPASDPGGLRAARLLRGGKAKRRRAAASLRLC